PEGAGGLVAKTTLGAITEGFAAFPTVRSIPTQRARPGPPRSANWLLVAVAARTTGILRLIGFGCPAIVLEMNTAGADRTFCALVPASTGAGIAARRTRAQRRAIARGPDRTIVAWRRHCDIGRVAFKIGTGSFGQFFAELVTQHARLDHFHATLGQIAQLERPIGNADQ